jgi:hypothetical protein
VSDGVATPSVSVCVSVGTCGEVVACAARDPVPAVSQAKRGYRGDHTGWGELAEDGAAEGTARVHKTARRCNHPEFLRGQIGRLEVVRETRWARAYLIRGDGTVKRRHLRRRVNT